MPGKTFTAAEKAKFQREMLAKLALANPLAVKAYKMASRKSKSRSYKPSKEFTRNINKYNNANCEKKIIPMKNYLNGPASKGYEQDIPCAALPDAGLVTGALSAVVLQTGENLTDMNDEMNTDSGATVAYSMGGYKLTQGTGTNQIVGKYCKFTSTYLNLNITMDPLQDTVSADSFNAQLPHEFRIIQVRARRDKLNQNGNVTTNLGEPSIGYNLFLNESGTPKGIIDEIATQDVFTWFVNKQIWTVLKDERFTLSTPTLLAPSTDATRVIAPNIKGLKSNRFKKYWLPKPTDKVRYSFTAGGTVTQEPIDFNTATHTIILCKNTSSGERPSNHWSVQANGASAFIDE